jgi:hypothetical protein
MAALYLDADVSVHVAPVLRYAGHTATTADAMGLNPDLGLPLENELYEWSPSRGWVRYESP